MEDLSSGSSAVSGAVSGSHSGGTQFRTQQIPVMTYHAKMPHDARQAAHMAFLTGSCSLLVATVAFGMGIDKVSYHAW
jgi:superfamily II DNA helicase RecQ